MEWCWWWPAEERKGVVRTRAFVRWWACLRRCRNPDTATGRRSSQSCLEGKGVVEGREGECGLWCGWEWCGWQGGMSMMRGPPGRKDLALPLEASTTRACSFFCVFVVVKQREEEVAFCQSKAKELEQEEMLAFPLLLTHPFFYSRCFYFVASGKYVQYKQTETSLERLLQNYYVMCAFTCVYPPSVLNAPCPGPPSSADPHSLHRLCPNPPC